MKRIYSFIILCMILTVRIMAQNGTSAQTKDWEADEEGLRSGCSYVRSSQGGKKAVLFYSIKKNNKMFVAAVDLSDLKSGIHQMVYIDEESPYEPACTDVLLIRQDGGKVYCQSEDGTKEWLIMDFDLETGDTFVDGSGVRYMVKEVANSDEKRKRLQLVSEDGTREDTWVEGIGSLQWGFLPSYVAKTLKSFQHVNESLSVYLWAAMAPDYFVGQSVDDEYFKLQPFEGIEDETTENMSYTDLPESPLTYSFIGDTLWIQGYYPLNLYRSFASARITGTQVDISIHQVTPLDIIKGMHVAKIDVRIPGFKAGTYQVGMPGGEYETLECKGPADGIDVVRKGAAGTDKRTYDLQGRPVPSKPQRGLYIQGGRIKATK